MRRTITVMTVTLALLGSACFAPATATGSPATSAPSTPAQPMVLAKAKPTTRKIKRTPAILAPRPGAKVTKHRVTIRVRAPYGVRTARLNSTKLRRGEFTLAENGIKRSLVASSSHGLRHGRNVLTVTINKRYRGKVTKKVRFTVKGKRLLTGAGRSREIVAGSSVTLQGTTRRHPTQRDRVAKATWRIVSTPAGSTATLSQTSGRSPRLTTDLPGEYVVRATGRSGGKAATNDTVTISAPESPMVPFNGWSQDGAGNLGISVGGRFYPGSLPLQDSAWQMLVLDRNTLGVEEGDNRTYGRCGDGWCVGKDGSGPAEPVTMSDELEDLKSDKLVVLIHRAQFGQSALPNPFTKFLNIPDGAQPDPSRDDSAAIIGVPGKNASVQTYMHDTAGKADLSGSMMRDRNINYTFVDDARVQFDTRASQTCDKTSCTVTVAVGKDKSDYGKVTRSFTVADGQAGIAVVRLDRRTLGLRDAQFLATNGANPDQIRDRMVSATNYLRGLPPDDLVIITSVVSPGAVLMGRPSPLIGIVDGNIRNLTGDPATQLGAEIAKLGGSRHRFLQAGVQPNDGYTLVGYRGLPEGQGNEIHARRAQLSGVFQRDAGQMFVTRAVNPGPDRFDTFTDQVMSAPNTVSFPGQDDPTFMAAFRCVAGQLPALKSANPRRLYWSGYFDKARPDWGQLSQDVDKLSDAGCPGLDTDTVGAATKQLKTELNYLRLLDAYVEALKVPYSSAQATEAVTDTSALAQDLKLTSEEAKAKGVKVDWFALLATAIEAVAPFLAPYLGSQASKAAEKLVERLTHALAAATAGALEMGGSSLEADEQGDKYVEDLEFQAKVADLGSDIAKKLVTTTESFDRMFEVVASDWRKLSTLGPALARCERQQRADPPIVPGDPDFTCDPSLYTADIPVAKAKAAASRSIEQKNYETILPLTYPVTELPWDGKITTAFGEPEGNWDATLFDCFNAVPFPASWPDESKPFLRRSLGQYRDPAYRYGASVQRPRETVSAMPQFETFVIAAFGNNRFNVETPEKQIERFFGEIEDSTDAVDGGLGADPVDFVLSQKAQNQIQQYPLGCGGFESVNTVPAPLDR